MAVENKNLHEVAITAIIIKDKKPAWGAFKNHR